jgi:hypothetical protein
VRAVPASGQTPVRRLTCRALSMTGHRRSRGHCSVCPRPRPSPCDVARDARMRINVCGTRKLYDSSTIRIHFVC